MLPDFDPSTVAPAEIPAALAALAGWQTALATRLMATPAPAPEAASDVPDKMLTAAEAAATLRRSKKWLYRHQKTLPFARRLSERSWVYSEAGLRRWLARQRA